MGRKCPKCGSELDKTGACTNYMNCTFVGSSAFDFYKLDDSVESELKRNLIIINEIIKRQDLNATPKFYILGGAALIFHGLATRVTMDIDTANKLSDEVKGLVGEFISDNASEVVKLGVGYESRAVRYMENELDAVEVYLLTEEDLLITKVMSGRQKDFKDIVSTDLITRSNVAKAKSILELEYDNDTAKKYSRMIDELYTKSISGELSRMCYNK